MENIFNQYGLDSETITNISKYLYWDEYETREAILDFFNQDSFFDINQKTKIILICTKNVSPSKKIQLITNYFIEEFKTSKKRINLITAILSIDPIIHLIARFNLYYFAEKVEIKEKINKENLTNDYPVIEIPLVTQNAVTIGQYLIKEVKVTRYNKVSLQS